ncbi:MAG TPA: MFS transporter [Candidatus Limnocylindria bacterium]|nr:MFS transporter [Candidatus Limnocylindria bacterium]
MSPSLRRARPESPPAPPLSAVARRLLLATFVASLGNGLVLPFLVVYLSQVRGMSTAIGGLVIAWSALLGLTLTPLGGWLIDRVGPRPVLLVGLGFEALASASWAFVHEPWQAFAVASSLALGGAGVWAAASTFLSRSVAEEQRQRAFGLNFLLVNLGIAVGGLVSGLIIDVSRPTTFEALYVADGVFVLLGLGVVASMRGLGGPVPQTGGDEEEDGGYREILRDRALMRLVGVAVVLLTCGYGALEVGFPVFATTQADLSVRLVAFGFVGNTVAIVLGQMYVIRLIAGRSRSHLIAVVGLVWALAWLLLSLSVPLSGGAAAVVALSAPIVFAVGETIWQPVVPTLINDLAPERLRGRYNAIGSLSWNVAGTLGPAMTGILLGADLAGVWVAVVVGGCLLAAGAALRLRHVLTPLQDGRVPIVVAEVGG